MTNDNSNPSGFDGLIGWEEGSAPPKRRIKDAVSAHALFVVSRDADKQNAYSRKTVQEMIDGEPPYDDAEILEMGHGEAVNLNFLEGSGIIESALSSYNDLTSSVDQLVTCHTTYGDPSERPELTQIISEEWTRMNKEWPRFEFNVQYLANKYVPHGVGVAFHDDDIDWRWKTAGLGDFLLPRDTEACEEEIEYAFARRSYPVSRLYQFIENETLARELGWNPAIAKQMIWTAYKNGSEGPTENEWEEFQAQIKNNDLFIGHGRAPKVKVAHLYAREFSGKLSHYMIDERGDHLDDFLFQQPDRFAETSDCFTIFTYGIGNGYYHGIRGLGYKIFPHIQVSNRMRCRLVEGGMLGSSLLVQPQNAEDLEALNLVYYGPYAVLPPNMKILERTIPNFAQNVMPLVNDLSRQIQNNTGSYQSRAVTPEGGSTERTKFEVQAQLQQESVLSTAAMNLFYLPWKRLMGSSFRRIQNRNYQQDDPGGKAVFEMRRRCVSRGVPVEAIYKVDHVEPVRAIGYGSPGNRLMALDEINQLAAQFDPVGRRLALRDRVAVRVGYETADRYVPKDPSMQRPPIDAKIAELENSAMHSGGQVSVQPGEMDSVHLGIHMGDIASTIADVNNGQTQGGDALPYFGIALPHSAEHLRAMQQDPMAIQATKQVEAALGMMFQAVQKIEGGALQEMQAQHDEMQAQAASQADAGAPPDPKLAQQIAAHQAKIAMMQQTGQVQLTLKAQDAAQKMHIRDANAAVKLAHQQAAQQVASQPVSAATGGQPSALMNGLASLIKAGVPITHADVNGVLLQAGLQPLPDSPATVIEAPKPTTPNPAP